MDCRALRVKPQCRGTIGPGPGYSRRAGHATRHGRRVAGQGGPLNALLEAKKAALAGAKNDAKKERAERLQAGKPVDNDPQSPANKRKAKRNAYQRELMRKRRGEKAAKAAPADTL